MIEMTREQERELHDALDELRRVLAEVRRLTRRRRFWFPIATITWSTRE